MSGDSSNSTSSSSSSSSSEPDFQLYKHRPDWHDITPMSQDDGLFSLVSIAYTEQFKDTFDYFRAVLHKDEMSERSLQLTKDCISLNPSNYTIWYFRRKILKHLNKDLFHELEYLDEVIKDNSKNYQVWHHRKCIVEWLKESICNKDTIDKKDNKLEQTTLTDLVNYEKKFLEYMINQDSKNYHAWHHRQWLVSEFTAWDDEIQYTNKLIEDDIRNNSAWNHRYYVISNTKGFTTHVLETEIDFVCEKIKLVPNNESLWNYLRGILNSIGLNASQVVNDMCKDLYKNNESKSPYLLAYMIDAIDELLSGQDDIDKSLLGHALDLCHQLASHIDVIRKEYWNFIARQLQTNYDK